MNKRKIVTSMDKKGLSPLGIAVSMVLIIVITFSAGNAAAKYFGIRNTQQAIEDFYNLKTDMEDVKPGNVRESFLRVDRDTAVVAFKADSYETLLLENFGFWEFKDIQWGETIFSIKRFSSCEQNKPCLCLIKNIEGTYWPNIFTSDINIYDPIFNTNFDFNDEKKNINGYIFEIKEEDFLDGNVICTTIEGARFKDYYYYKDIGYPTQEEKREEDESYGFKDGFFFLNSEPFNYPKNSYLYIGKSIDNEIEICFEKDCLALQVKGQSFVS